MLLGLIFALSAWAAPSEKILFNFSAAAVGQPFHVVADKSGGRVGTLTSRKYYNFAPSKILNGNWKGYDRLEFDIYSPTDEYHDLNVTLGDSQSSDYWTKLNFKTALGQGWNHISVPLDQYLGERGSHKHQRSLDLTRIENFFIIIDPNEMKPTGRTFHIDNIKLSTRGEPTPPADVRAFDFTAPGLSPSKSMTTVWAGNEYASDRGFGFMPKASFWRAEDASALPESLRGTIGILEGTFRVNLPNGEYEGSLVWDRLGYWDPSFWQRRFVGVNGLPVRQESRSRLSDYLDDVLRFESVEPTSDQNPYDLFVASIFRPVEFKFSVKNGVADFEFRGDATGVSLNRLIIWPSKSRTIAQDYLKSLSAYERSEQLRLTRPLSSPKLPAAIPVGAVSPSLRFGLDRSFPVRNQLLFRSGTHGRPFQVIQFPGGDIQWEVSSLKGPKGEVVKAPVRAHQLINQFSSPDMNHETYMVVGKFFKPVSGQFQTPGNQVRTLWIDLPITSELTPGKWTGEFSLTSNGKTTKLAMEVRVGNYRLERPQFPVGFFNLDPMPAPYFHDPALLKFKGQLRKSALDLLRDNGFTAFSGLPEVQGMDTSPVEELLLDAKKAGMLAVYSYGGNFPHALLQNKANDQEVGALLGRLSKGIPRLVHTFSDEADGYSGRLKEDLALAKDLKKRFPMLAIGGFGSMESENADELNVLFDDAFYTKVDDWKARQWTRQSGQRWGAYNGAPGNMDDPRFGFGLGLFLAREKGLSHFLEWQALNNLPYFELDGRETDVPAWLPSQEGKVLPTVRFKLAAQGLQAYMKLVALSKLAQGPTAAAQKAQAWLEEKADKEKVFQAPRLLRNPEHDFAKFEAELDQVLETF